MYLRTIEFHFIYEVKAKKCACDRALRALMRNEWSRKDEERENKQVTIRRRVKKRMSLKWANYI